MNRAQIESLVTRINHCVSSMVIPDELEKWYYLLNYIRVQPGRMHTVTLDEHYGMKGVSLNFSKVKYVTYNDEKQEYEAKINDGNGEVYDTILLKNIVSIEPSQEVTQETKRLKVQDANDADIKEKDKGVCKFKETLLFPYEHLETLDVNHLPSDIEMTQEQLELVKTYLQLCSVFGCPIIRKPTLHQDPDQPQRWFVLFAFHKDRGFRWYCPPDQAKEQLEKDNANTQPEFKSELKYRDVKEFKDLSNVDVGVISMFLQSLKINFFDKPSIHWGCFKPVLKILFQNQSVAWLDMQHLDNFTLYDPSAFYTHSIKYILTEWDEPIVVAAPNFDLDFLCHRFVLKYSWSMLTGGWMNCAAFEVPSVYYLFERILLGDEASGKFVDSIGTVDFIIQAIKYELDHTTAVPEEQARLIRVCLELIPFYFENHDDESEYMHNKRIGYTLKQTMTTWFDNLMSLACQYHVLINADWAADYIKRLLNIYDIRWMLTNLVIWSETSFHTHHINWIVRAFDGLDQSKLTNMSRDNLAIVKSIAANHHYPKEAMLDLAKSQTHIYVKRYKLFHKAGFNFAANFEFSRAAYSVKDMDTVYVQFLQSVGAKTISLSLAEIMAEQDVKMLTLMCLQTTPETVMYKVLDVCGHDSMSESCNWALNVLTQIKPIIATMKDLALRDRRAKRTIS